MTVCMSSHPAPLGKAKCSPTRASILGRPRRWSLALMNWKLLISVARPTGSTASMPRDWPRGQCNLIANSALKILSSCHSSWKRSCDHMYTKCLSWGSHCIRHCEVQPYLRPSKSRWYGQEIINLANHLTIKHWKDIGNAGCSKSRPKETGQSSGQPSIWRYWLCEAKMEVVCKVHLQATHKMWHSVLLHHTLLVAWQFTCWSYSTSALGA